MMIALALVPLLAHPGGGPGDALTAEPWPRFRLQEEPAASPWSGSVNFGLVLTQGNSETFTLNFTADAVREVERHRWTFYAFYNYGEQTKNDIKQNTIADGGGTAKYDYKVNEHLYYYGNAYFKRDKIADLDSRIIVGAGSGYTFKDTEKLKWSGEGGVSYVTEQYNLASTSTESDSNDSVSLRLASNVDWKISESANFTQIAEALPSLEDSKDYYARFNNRLAMSLTDTWQAMLQYVLEYDNTPAPGAQKADHRVIFTLGWSFGKK